MNRIGYSIILYNSIKQIQNKLKNLFYFFIPFVFACAPSKSPYYFDHVKLNNPEKIETLQEVEPLLAPDFAASASLSSEPVVFSNNEIFENVVPKIPFAESNRKEKKRIKNVLINQLKAKPNEGTRSDKGVLAEKENSANGFAIAGFVSSLVGLLFPPLCIVGIVFSALGLKSEKKGLAIAGLVIGIAVLALALLVVAFLSLGSWS